MSRLSLSFVLTLFILVATIAAHAQEEDPCDGPNPPKFCKEKEDPGEDEEEGGGAGCDGPTVSPDGRYEYGCWNMDSLANCPDMELGIGRQVIERDADDVDDDDDEEEWVGNHTERRCVGPEDGGVDPWKVWAGVNVSSGGIGSELAGTEEIPIWTGYENGFWFEGDTEASDTGTGTEPLTGFTITVEVRAWPSEVAIDTGDDGPLSGDSDTSTYTLTADEYRKGDYGSAEDPLFTHVYETKGTDAGHDCACFIASVEGTWSGEYRWEMGGVATDWKTFDHQVEAEPTLVALQVWEVISRLR